MNSPKAFLSYVKENEGIIRVLDQCLTDYGVDVVTNYRNIDGGANWKRTLKQLIEDSGYFVICFSKEFNRRERSVAYRELHDAIECAKDFPFDRKWIIPVRINECTIPTVEIGSQGMLDELQWIDLFPSAKWYEGVESIVRAIDKELITNPQEALAFPDEIEIIKKLGFDMGEYTCNEIGYIKFNFRREYWSQSKWLVVYPETLLKLPNYITAIVSGTREGLLNEIRLSLSINNHSGKDDAYDAFIKKCNQLCIEICEQDLPKVIIDDLIQLKDSFTDDRKFRPHAIYTDNDYRLEGININMHNEVYHQSPLNETPTCFRFHITKFSFTS